MFTNHSNYTSTDTYAVRVQRGSAADGFEHWTNLVKGAEQAVDWAATKMFELVARTDSRALLPYAWEEQLMAGQDVMHFEVLDPTGSLSVRIQNQDLA